MRKILNTASVLIRRGKFEFTQIGRRPCEEGGRDWNEVFTVKECRGFWWQTRESGKRTKDYFLEPLKRASS